MKYDTREEVERIGIAGSKMVKDKRGIRFRYLSSFWLYVEDNDLAFTPHGRDGFWESWVTRWISEELEKNQLFVDVGANVGYYSMLAGTSRVDTIAIEPNPHLIKNIMDAARVNKCEDKLKVAQIALSDSNGDIRLIIPDRHSGGALISSLDDSPTLAMPYEIVTVDRRTFDRAFAFGFVPQNILMKIDAEGSEPSIWDGMQESWHKHNITAVLEWHGIRWKDEHKLTFANKLFQNKVYLLNYEGHEEPITIDWLMSTNDLHMIIVRKNETV